MIFRQIDLHSFQNFVIRSKQPQLNLKKLILVSFTVRTAKGERNIF